ncbi:MAG: C40 family peptidase [Acidobacteriota bacterium]|nr:C40 family peptidase [Acidobacteriota bacterium]
MNFCKSLSVFLFSVLFSAFLSGNAFAQERERVIQTDASQHVASLENKLEQRDLPKTYQSQKPVLTNKIIIAPPPRPLVQKTVSSQPITTAVNNFAGKNSYNAVFNQKLLGAIQSRIGTPYLYGSSGPNRYDCSGLVWSVFQEAGFSFERASVRTLWQNSEPVSGADQYKVGTLIFLNGLAHIGIVADENGFYHASSSHGVMYSRFDGYWKDRIVGFRRMKMDNSLVSLK